MIRVLVADDQASVRTSLRHLLGRYPDIEVTGEAGSGPDAVVVAARHAPDVVLMDVRMPDGDGIAATRVLAAAPWRIPVLVITTFDVDEYVFGAIEAGAAGFLLKTSQPDTYADAIRAAARGDGMVSPEVTRRVLAAVSGVKTTSAASAVAELTGREIEIVRALGASPTTNEAIAGRLSIEPATVKGHLKRIMAKLGLGSRAELVAWAFRNGVLS